MNGARPLEVLRSRWLFHLGAAALTYMFWWSGLTKMFDLGAAGAEMAHFGLHPPLLFAIATITLQLAGSALVIFGGRYAWLGAAALAGFTLATIPLAHDFWNMTGDAAVVHKLFAQEHCSVVGGLLLAAILAAHRQNG